MKQVLARGRNLRLLELAREPAHQQHPGPPSQDSGKRKAHKQKLFCPVGLGTTPGLSRDFTGFVPGRNPVKTWDKPWFSPYFTQWKPDFTGFVPGTNPVCPWDNPGDEGRHRKFM